MGWLVDVGLQVEPMDARPCTRPDTQDARKCLLQYNFLSVHNPFVKLPFWSQQTGGTPVGRSRDQPQTERSHQHLPT